MRGFNLWVIKKFCPQTRQVSLMGMKTKIIKAILATILLTIGLSKASAVFDPSAAASKNEPVKMAGGLPCTTACSYLA